MDPQVSMQFRVSDGIESCGAVAAEAIELYRALVGIWKPLLLTTAQQSDKYLV
jgi:hypothetical protein